MDSIGPRLTGSPANRAANDWLLRTYQAWGVDAKNERYGTWRDWTRGTSGLELVAPRRRVLEATMLAWSASTPAGGVTTDVVIVPTAKEIVDSAGFARWLGSIKGKLVLAGMPQPSCRPDSDVRFWADSATYQHSVALRDSATADWSGRFTAAHVSSRALPALLERAGVAGVLTNSWSRGWGVDKIQSARVTGGPIVRCVVRGLFTARAPGVERPASARPCSRRSDARSGRVAGVQHHRANRGTGEARRVRDALGAPRLVGCRQRCDRQRHGHDHDARGDAHPQNGLSEAEAHDPRRALERRGAGRNRLAARSRPITPR